MSDHEFEKKVQVKMDELKFRPSEAVWLGVEKKIRGDRRRRRVLLWLPIFLLGLSAGGYLLLQQDSPEAAQAAVQPHSSSANQTNTTTKDNSTQNKKPAVTQQATGDTEPETGKINQPEKITANETAQPASKQTITTVRRQPKNVQPAIPSITSNEQKVIKQEKPSQQVAEKNQNTKTRTQEIPDMENVSANNIPQHGNEVPVSDPVQSELLLNASAVNKTKQQWIFNTAFLAQEPITGKATSSPAAKAKPIVRPVKKWQWGFQATGGFSNISKQKFLDLRSIFQGEKSLVEDLASADQTPAAGFNNQYNLNLSINPPLSKQSDLRIGYAYSVEGFVQRPVSRRISFSLGLQYAYYSVQTTIGQLVNNSQSVNIGMSSSRLVDQYYGGHMAQNYVNRYHFLGIPVMGHLQLNKSKKIPILLDAGVSVSRLLSTNALHYDGVHGVYYKDNSLFNRTHVALLTGLNVGLLQRTKHPVYIGPSLRYSLTGTVKNDVSAGQYLWSTGLSVKMLLKK